MQMRVAMGSGPKAEREVSPRCRSSVPRARRLALRPALTEFERGIRRFGYLFTHIMPVLVMIVLAINIFMAKPPVESLLQHRENPLQEGLEPNRTANPLIGHIEG